MEQTGDVSHYTAVVEVDPEGVMTQASVSTNATLAAITALDLDGDTVTDVLGYLSGPSGVAVVAHGNQDDGTFDSPVPIDTTWSEIDGAAVADFDDDGNLDYLWWNDSGDVRMGSYLDATWTHSIEVHNEMVDVDWTPAEVPLAPHPRAIHLGDEAVFDLWDGGDEGSMDRHHVHWAVVRCDE